MNTLPSLDKTVLCDSSPEDTLVVFPTASLAGAAQTSASDTAASSYGPYKLGKKLGEGGFGSVYEAEQEHPVKRRVAIKIIKLGMDTREVIARFEAERQALAMMQHPNIARVLDVGTSHAGRPYFVMELVQGEPISSYCDSNQLSIIQRLQLFDQLCQAVQHAHTKGVIHRDLKPNNVLVSTENEQPLVKVIDFGIAKATSGHLTDHGLLTAQLQMVGTPLYMSPEQAQGSADIDTRTDIYSLGVLLYQLLTDSTPFESSTLRVAQYAEMLHIINAFKLGNFLTTIGMARTGLKQFPTAEANLLEAQGIFVMSSGPNPKTARRCIQAIVELYRAWHAAEPSKGYAAKAAEWQRKLSESSAPG